MGPCWIGSVLKMWGPIYEIALLFLNQNIYCRHLKEASRWDCSFEHTQHVFQLSDLKIIYFYAHNFIFNWSFRLLRLSPRRTLNPTRTIITLHESRNILCNHQMYQVFCLHLIQIWVTADILLLLWGVGSSLWHAIISLVLSKRVIRAFIQLLWVSY